MTGGGDTSGRSDRRGWVPDTPAALALGAGVIPPGTPRQWRGYRPPSNWPKLRRAALARDDHTCLTCGAPATSVDHVVPVSRGGDHDMENLASICGPCHEVKTKAEIKQAQARVSRRRPNEAHPGLL